MTDLIRINGALQVAGTNARMKMCLAKIDAEIKRTDDRRRIALLNRLWHRVLFGLVPEKARKAA